MTNTAHSFISRVVKRINPEFTMCGKSGDIERSISALVKLMSEPTFPRFTKEAINLTMWEGSIRKPSTLERDHHGDMYDQDARRAYKLFDEWMKSRNSY